MGLLERGAVYGPLLILILIKLTYKAWIAVAITCDLNRLRAKHIVMSAGNIRKFIIQRKVLFQPPLLQNFSEQAKRFARIYLISMKGTDAPP